MAMRRSASFALLLSAATLPVLFPLAARAGLNPGARLGLHLLEPGSAVTCAGAQDDFPSCDSIRTSVPVLGEFRAVVVLHNFSVVSGVAFTLAWPSGWEIYQFERCADFMIGGDVGQNPMGVALAWSDDQPAPPGGGGRPVGLVYGYADSAGCLRIVEPGADDGFHPVVTDSLYAADRIASWSDGCVGVSTPDEPCAYGAAGLVARFGAEEIPGPGLSAYQFSDSSTGSPTSWFWDFGDGETSVERSPAHVYLTCGVFTVSLQVASETAVDDTFRLRVTDAPDPLGAEFSAAPVAGCSPVAVQFTDLSDGIVEAWRWSFGDGQVSFAQHPLHTYITPGVYDVSLRVTRGCPPFTVTYSDYIQVGAPTPYHPPFGSDVAQGCAPLAVRFESHSALGAYAWLWDFGDGTTSTARDPMHTYPVRGAYTVSLTESYPCGPVMQTRPGYIRSDLPPAGVIGWGLETCVHEPICFAHNFQGGVITSLLWNFGDGTTSAEADPCHVYSAVGDYHVTLTVFTPCGDAVASELLAVRQRPVCSIVATQLQGPYAEAVEGGIRVRWIVIPPSESEGYNVLRSTSPFLPFVRVNAELLPDLTAGGTRTHEFVDGSALPGVDYWYRLEDVGLDGTRIEYAVGYPVRRIDGTVAREPGLALAYPAPAGGEVVFEASLPAGETTFDLAIYDAQGRLVMDLARSRTGSGLVRLAWNGRSADGGEAPPGVYYARLRAAGGAWTRKVVLGR